MIFAMDVVKDSIPRQLPKLAAPSCIGYFFDSVFNGVDTYLHGKLSTDALIALSLTLPVFVILWFK